MERVEGEKAALQELLDSAQKLVKQVMAEGGKLLDSYHLDYSDIDFGGEDVEKWLKLGEGAQVETNNAAAPYLSAYIIASRTTL